MSHEDGVVRRLQGTRKRNVAISKAVGALPPAGPSTCLQNEEWTAGRVSKEQNTLLAGNCWHKTFVIFLDEAYHREWSELCLGKVERARYDKAYANAPTYYKCGK